MVLDTTPTGLAARAILAEGFCTTDSTGAAYTPISAMFGVDVARSCRVGIDGVLARTTTDVFFFGVFFAFFGGFLTPPPLPGCTTVL